MYVNDLRALRLIQFRLNLDVRLIPLSLSPLRLFSLRFIPARPIPLRSLVFR